MNYSRAEEPHLISSEASHMFLKINQKLCANASKGIPQLGYCVVLGPKF